MMGRDIIVRGSPAIVDQKALRTLQRGQTLWYWRGPRPRDIRKGNRVLFVDQGRLYRSAIYDGYQYVRDYNLQGVCQKGWAIRVTGPTSAIQQPLNQQILKGPWRWRYADNAGVS